MKKAIYISFMLFLSLSGISQAFAQDTPPAGTEIPNTAQARYFDPVISDTLNIGSNTVRATIQAFNGPSISLSKQVLQSNVAQGDLLSFQINGSNSGDFPAQPITVTVDGSEHEFVILLDKVPANTILNDVLDVSGGQVLYHRYQDSEGVYVSNAPSELEEVDEIAFAFSSLEPGISVSVSFDVRINQNAAGPIINTAVMHYSGVDGAENSKASNEVSVSLPDHAPTLTYYRDNTYDSKTNTASIGNPLFLQANAAACNTRFGQIDTTSIIIRSTLTEDEESFEAVETEPNSGMFRILPNIPTVDASQNPVVQGNQVMEITEDDNLVAQLTECGVRSRIITANILVSPFGVVFGSLENEPVAGATVLLIDVTGEGNGGDAGGPALVFDENGDRELSNQQVTEEDGTFAYPYLNASTYRVEVITPPGYIFSSDASPEELADNRRVEVSASYGREFVIEEDATAANFDIPLDPDSTGVLFTSKTADREIMEIGDFANYQVEVQNNSPQPVTNVHIEDTLPFGFKYEKGTARINGSSISDPEGDKGPVLYFEVGEIPGNGSVSLTYRALVGAGALNGDGVNTAVATADEVVRKVSNTARHKAQIRGGVFTDEGYIIGKVFMDCNENDMQDVGEVGIPGVRLYLENGTFVITDVEGKYSFYGVKPNKHILKIDNYSLPEGSKLAELDNRHAGDPSSRFVDLKNGQMHRADFAICNCDATTHAEIELRKEQFGEVGDEIGTSIKKDLRTEENARVNYGKREQASGMVQGTKIPNFKAAGESESAQFRNQQITGGVSSEDRALEKAMIQEKAELGFIGISDGDTLNATQQRIWVKSRLGANLALSVNGKKVDDKKVSKRSKLSELEIQALEYIGVELEAGNNLLTLTETDPFGNERGSVEIAVYAPGKVEDIKLSVPVNDVPADGTSAAVVRVKLVDDSGVAVQTKIPVTLDATAGEWLVEDNDPNNPGIQAFVENGESDFKLKSTIEPQDVKVRVSAGVLESEASVIFLPDLRPLLAAGIIEGTIRLNGSANIVPARSADGFERELKALSYSIGSATADARAAFFLKGKIKGDYLLTASFDSEKENERLFRDIQPDEFYPVYGESSVKGYDAQSTGRLYVRIDKKRSYALYGDFITQDRHPAKSLGEYNRTQTGFKGHYETNKARFNVFGSNAISLQRIDEFRALGISGPYELQFDNILINSEQVDIITRDRNQPSIIISEERLSRFRDYVIEPFTGNIIFKAPVASLDENLNPVFIRVTYEVEDGESYLIGGFDGQYKLTDNFELGASFVEDRNPENEYRLKSANTTLRLSENTTIIGEVAESTTELDGNGQGGRLEVQHRGSRVDARVFAGKTDKDFINRSATLGRARTEAGARSTVKLDSKTNLQGEFLYTSNDTTETGTTGALVNVQRRINEDLRVELGVRHSRQDQNSTQNQVSENIINTNLRGKVTTSVPKVESATVFGEYEQDVNAIDRKVIAVGGDYRLKDRGKIYARHEFISSAQGRYTLNSNLQRNNTVVGLDANYMKNGEVFSEYRIADAFDGRSAQAAIGLRNRFMIQEGFGINAGFERIFSVMGEPLNEGTAISAAMDYTANPMWKATARAEARFSNNGNIYLNTLGYGRKINRDWTFLGKNVFALSTSSKEGVSNKIQQRLRLGMAYRQTDTNQLDGLGRYELKYEQNDQFSEGFDRLVHIFSTHLNYHPTADWTFSGRAAAKKVAESYDELDSRSITSLLSARAVYDITRKLDGGVNVSLLGNDGFKSQDYGLGAEVGFIAQRNLRLAVGFNFSGFYDKDLSESNYTRKGVYVGFSYKFDERLFKGLMPDGKIQNPEVYETCECAVKIPEPLTMPKPDMSFELKAIELKAPEFNHEVLRKLKKLPNEIHFGFDESSISENSARMLDLVADYLKNDDAFDLEIRGYTDRSGSNEYNLKLSERRASTVRAYLVGAGVDPEKVIFRGLSFKDSTGTGEKDIVDRSKSRKVELSLNSPKQDALFVPQVQDLKVERELPSSGAEWDYVFNPQHNAVPAWIHFEEGTAEMNEITRYLLDRIVLTLSDHPEARITLRIPKLVNEELIYQRVAALTSYLSNAGLSGSQIDVQEALLTSASQIQQRRVQFIYSGSNDLVEVNHDDDIALPKDKDVVEILMNMLETLKGREDRSLIEDRNNLSAQ